MCWKIMDSNIVGIIAGVLTAVSLIPQFVKCLKEKDATEISWFMLIILFFGNAIWAYYGILIDALPVTITNGFSLLMDSALLVLKFKYGRKS